MIKRTPKYANREHKTGPDCFFFEFRSIPDHHLSEVEGLRERRATFCFFELWPTGPDTSARWLDIWGRQYDQKVWALWRINTQNIKKGEKLSTSGHIQLAYVKEVCRPCSESGSFIRQAKHISNDYCVYYKDDWGLTGLNRISMQC